MISNFEEYFKVERKKGEAFPSMVAATSLPAHPVPSISK
jgi:hypothetical protein